MQCQHWGIDHPRVVSERMEEYGAERTRPIAGVELCFGYDSNDESHRQIDCMGDLYSRRAITANVPSIVVEDWNGGKWTAWCRCCYFSVVVGCFVSWCVGGKSWRRSAIIGFVTWNSLRRN